MWQEAPCGPVPDTMQVRLVRSTDGVRPGRGERRVPYAPPPGAAAGHGAASREGAMVNHAAPPLRG